MMNFILIEGKISPKLTRARGSSASSLDGSVVSKKIMESRRKQCYEKATSKNEPRLFFIIAFFTV